MSDKVELGEKIQAVDQGIKELWDAMDETNQKLLKSELFILNRYISSVSAPTAKWQKGKKPTEDEQLHYLLFVNEYFNKHWNTLQPHPKLLWLMLCMCSYDNKTVFFHEWIGNKKRTGNSKKIRFLEEIYPNKKTDEIDLLAKIITDDELKELARDYGFEESLIKKKL